MRFWTLGAVAALLAAPTQAATFSIGPVTASSLIEVKGSGHSGGGSHSVRGYTRKDGTYVAPHQQTNPNSSKYDNWSTKGNVNPYTGKKGTVDPEAPSTK